MNGGRWNHSRPEGAATASDCLRLPCRREEPEPLLPLSVIPQGASSFQKHLRIETPLYGQIDFDIKGRTAVDVWDRHHDRTSRLRLSIRLERCDPGLLRAEPVRS